MKIVVASGAFKDVYSPMESCRLIEEVLKDVLKEKPGVEITTIPVADGGEYSADVLLAQLACEKIVVPHVVDPRGIPREAYYVKLDEQTAYIASSVILGLSPEMSAYKNPLYLTSYGFGQLIKDAVNKSFKRLIIGLGGTNTVDAGIGMAQALGVHFLGSGNGPLIPLNEKHFTGEDLSLVQSIEFNGLLEKFRDIEVNLVCDADITVEQMSVPTTQKIGKDFDFERQSIVQILNESLLKFCRVIGETDVQMKTRQKFNQASIHKELYFGAAGGVGLSLFALFDITASLGYKFFFEKLKLSQVIRDADLVITGEGKVDISLHGKTPIGVSRLAKALGKPVLFLCGTVAEHLKSYFKSYLSQDLPKGFKDQGVETMLSCHDFYDKEERFVSYQEEVDFFREHNPRIFTQALRMYFEQKGELAL